MKTEKKILTAFLLNLSFSVLEFVGGVLTGSVAILSDAVHDMGDAAGIGISWLLEKKSRKEPDATYTYGYGRYSVLGGAVTTLILLAGSIGVIYHAGLRLLHPTDIHYNGMLGLAVVGVLVNFAAAYFTRGGESLNQKAVNLHMLEDVLGWAAVLVCAVIMRFTNWVWLDPVVSLVVAGYILLHAVQNLRAVLDILLEKAPDGISADEIMAHLTEIDGVLDVHHLHLWSIDGQNHCATAHVVINGDWQEVKEKIRGELREHGVAHAVLEAEREGEVCSQMRCRMERVEVSSHHHHHHH